MNKDEVAKIISKHFSDICECGTIPLEKCASEIADACKVDENTSDGFHTFKELYEHRIELWITICRMEQYVSFVWRTKTHSDGSVWDGWFILGHGETGGTQMTYHLPISRWDDCGFAQTLPQAPAYDGHTSADVLERLKRL